VILKLQNIIRESFLPHKFPIIIIMVAIYNNLANQRYLSIESEHCVC
jgi:hypothetical protein